MFIATLFSRVGERAAFLTINKRTKRNFEEQKRKNIYLLLYGHRKVNLMKRLCISGNVTWILETL
ncbi:MAG TPA: hypothetical protein VEP90_19140, partial [Methylomirabilota bacterium]|nr:hypothetical protein [Methylomirabilota bacterium]